LFVLTDSSRILKKLWSRSFTQSRRHQSPPRQPHLGKTLHILRKNFHFLVIQLTGLVSDRFEDARFVDSSFRFNANLLGYPTCGVGIVVLHNNFDDFYAHMKSYRNAFDLDSSELWITIRFRQYRALWNDCVVLRALFEDEQFPILLTDPELVPLVMRCPTPNSRRNVQNVIVKVPPKRLPAVPLVKNLPTTNRDAPVRV
jgi:hypothetical protein